MLRSEELDRESFEDILKAAVDKIPSIYPEWTNYNEADPGMTVTELFAWFTEIQQYHLNVIGKEHYLRYLKLLGCSPEREKAARTYLCITAENSRIPKGTVYYADDIPFETEYDIDVFGNSIVSVTGGEQTIENMSGMLSSEVYFHPFGEDGKGTFTLRLKNRPNEGELIAVYFSVEPYDGCKGHDEIDDSFIPYVEISCSGGKIVRDETFGFCRSGVMVVAATFSGSKDISFGIKSGEYVIPPVLRRVVLNVVPAMQKKTLAKTISLKSDRRSFGIQSEKEPKELYAVDNDKRIPVKDFTFEKGTIRVTGKSFGEYECLFFDEGFEAQRFAGGAIGLCSYKMSVEPEGFLTDSFEIYVEEADGIYRWQRVDDFDCSDKYSRHFVYDRAASQLVFGDGEKGMPPEGRVLITGGAVSLGDGGNIKAGTIDSFDELTSSRAVNITASAGGSEEQSIDECFAKARKMIEHPARCITFADFEDAVRRVPGVPVRRVKAFLDERVDNHIIIAVENVPDAKTINEGCLRNIRQYIAPRTVVGTWVDMKAPEYTGAYIYTELETDPYLKNVRRIVEEALKSYFGAVGFGAYISINALNRYLYELDWIKNVIKLDVSFSGSGAELLQNGDYQLGNGCLPRVGQVNVIF